MYGIIIHDFTINALVSQPFAWMLYLADICIILLAIRYWLMLPVDSGKTIAFCLLIVITSDLFDFLDSSHVNCLNYRSKTAPATGKVAPQIPRKVPWIFTNASFVVQVSILASFFLPSFPGKFPTVIYEIRGVKNRFCSEFYIQNSFSFEFASTIDEIFKNTPSSILRSPRKQTNVNFQV